MNIIEQLEKEQAAALSKKRKVPEFGPGDTLRVNVKVVEGERTRVQAYEGVCIGRAGRRGEREFHRAQDFLWRGRRARLPGPFAADRFDRGGAARPRAPRQALLSARPARQGGPHRRAPGGQRQEEAEAFKGFKRPKGEPDDLKLIPGVSAELEKKLNKLGLIKFEQIANLSDDEIGWLDEELSLKGAIEHDDWVAKSVALMAETTADEVPAEEERGGRGGRRRGQAQGPKAKRARRPAKEPKTKGPRPKACAKSPRRASAGASLDAAGFELQGICKPGAETLSLP